ncbi:MAG TPA: hypothetical protein VFI31_12770 [Pirellulales bacterium]|nr:hypothetical protein [Pirellulales bacterium]
MRKAICLTLAALVIGLGSVASVDAGAVQGPKVGYYLLRARHTDTYEVTFRGGRMAQVRVHRYGPAHLWLTVKNAQGDVVGQDKNLNGDAVVTFYPPADGTYTVEVLNGGRIPSRYFLSNN